MILCYFKNWSIILLLNQTYSKKGARSQGVQDGTSSRVIWNLPSFLFETWIWELWGAYGERLNFNFLKLVQPVTWQDRQHPISTLSQGSNKQNPGGGRANQEFQAIAQLFEFCFGELGRVFGTCWSSHGWSYQVLIAAVAIGCGLTVSRLYPKSRWIWNIAPWPRWGSSHGPRNVVNNHGRLSVFIHS